MHLRVIVRELGFRYTKLYEVLEFSFLGSYIFGRLIMWTPIVIQVQFIPEVPLLTRLSGTLLLFQSYHFMIKMIKIFKSRYNQWLERSQKGVEMNWFSTNPDVKKLNYVNSGKGETALL